MDKIVLMCSIIFI